MDLGANKSAVLAVGRTAKHGIILAPIQHFWSPEASNNLILMTNLLPFCMKRRGKHHHAFKPQMPLEFQSWGLASLINAAPSASRTCMSSP